MRALAYAERFGGDPEPGEPERAPLIRVDAIAEVDGVIRVLDLLDPSVRAAVQAFDGSDLSALYSSAAGRDFA